MTETQTVDLAPCGCCTKTDAAWIQLLNAAHDVTCKGCPWCRWTGRAQVLEIAS